MNVTRPQGGINLNALYTNYGAETVDISPPGTSLQCEPEETVSLGGTGVACATATGQFVAHWNAEVDLDDDEDVADLLLAQPEIVPAGTTDRALAKMDKAKNRMNEAVVRMDNAISGMKPGVPSVLTMEFWTSDRWHDKMP